MAWFTEAGQIENPAQVIPKEQTEAEDFDGKTVSGEDFTEEVD